MSGWSALFHAVSEGHLDMVCRLLEDEEDVHHEADLTLKDVVSHSHNVLRSANPGGS